MMRFLWDIFCEFWAKLWGWRYAIGRHTTGANFLSSLFIYDLTPDNASPGVFYIGRRGAMPFKPARPCGVPGCPELTHDRYCKKHKREADAYYNKNLRDPAERERYGKEWRIIRDRYLREHPLCEDCLIYGHFTPATEVHHSLPLSRGGTHEWENLRALCKRCHSSKTAREGGRWGW